MGITGDCAKFLLYAKQQGASYTSTMMLGRQQLFVNDNEVEEISRRWNIKLSPFKPGEFSEPFFKILQAGLIDSMDHSAFERATVLHDLNLPVDNALKSKYSVVFDGGTLEHVFNFPQAIKNCMDMLHLGGHFISVSPANNYCGHGFYQFSPELYFSLFRERNGFRVKLIALVVEEPGAKNHSWFQIKDPNEVKRRVTLSNSYPTSLLVLAEKIKEPEDILLTPFQSDYEHIWTVYDSIHDNKTIAGESRWLFYYRKLVPEFIKRTIRGVRNKNLDKTQTVANLGITNPQFFTKMDI